ncbi:FadR/GntR family transcriptional regulator [Streptococcus hongkongensis]|nr:GntR family transcriptional regulator [Streptococcus uberis]
MVKPLVGQTADNLLQLILNRNYEIGEKLPNEFELAQDLNVGRSTIREAVRSLVTRNILEVRQGSGTYISPKKGVSEDPFGFSLVKDRQSFLDDLDMIRLLIEPQIATLASQNISIEQIEDFEALVFKIIEAIETNDSRIIALDIDLHTRLAKYSNNLIFERLIPILLENQSDYQKYKSEFILSYESLLIAMKSRDSIKAHEAMQKYLFLHKLSKE